jgi:hypothetical protein
VELRFEDDPLAQSFVARIPELRATHQALGLTDEESRATIQALPRHVALHRSCAREVYPDHHTAECTSWLLDPQLAEALPPASNIVRFQRRFVLRDEGREANDDVRRFVFHTYERDLDKLTPRTTLERAFAERVRAGGTWRAPTGVTSLR